MQGTGGSTAMANSWEQLRKAGATARAMLVEAAAKDWGVPASEITVDRGIVSARAVGAAGDVRRAGAESEAASRRPRRLQLKDPKDWKLHRQAAARASTVGPRRTARRSSRMDVKLPGMLTALIARPPRFGATVKSFDAAPATAGARA